MTVETGKKHSASPTRDSHTHSWESTFVLELCQPQQLPPAWGWCPGWFGSLGHLQNKGAALARFAYHLSTGAFIRKHLILTKAPLLVGLNTLGLDANAHTGFSCVAVYDNISPQTQRHAGAKLTCTVRNNYEADMVDKDHRKRQMGTALYFIDKMALRAGHEKDEDEAETVGCCTLKMCVHILPRGCNDCDPPEEQCNVGLKPSLLLPSKPAALTCRKKVLD
eukprot:1158919-Pelagomonas_calceolata.AAC.9